jgi:hypothetical protein
MASRKRTLDRGLGAVPPLATNTHTTVVDMNTDADRKRATSHIRDDLLQH